MSENMKKPVSDRQAADSRSIQRNTTDAEHHDAFMARCRLWLRAFIDHINARRGKEIDAAQADALIAGAQEEINEAAS
jgi:hypothetical protein